ncbi:hypothetical protein GOV10_01310, partial [Candidatus Woesearchaeota archaeon]|nr:hypothetical protein [Candidatus Woesearchaeota archaeon]
LYDRAEEYAEEDITPTFGEFETWLEKEYDDSTSNYRLAGAAFDKMKAYQDQYSFDVSSWNQDAGFVVGCQGHEHPNVPKPPLFEGDNFNQDVKVWKLFRKEGHDLQILREGGDDWFTEKIAENYTEENYK